MTPKEFKKRFHEGKTWKDAEIAIKCLTKEQRTQLRDALLMTYEYTGLDMRQEFFLGLLRAFEQTGE